MESAEQLQANIQSLEALPNTAEFWEPFEHLGIEDEQILVPANWKMD